MKLLHLLNSIKTAYRRIDHPGINKLGFVVDLGSGGIPNPMADIACDAIDSDSERDTRLKIDRPFVWANMEHLPFKDKAFGYSILSHVLEHLHNPKDALTEVQRICGLSHFLAAV